MLFQIKRDYRYKKNDTGRVTYGCDEGCPFYCHISKDGNDQDFKIKTLNLIHDCDDAYENKRASTDTLAQYFRRKIQNNTKYKIKEMKDELETQFKLNVSKSKLKRLKGLLWRNWRVVTWMITIGWRDMHKN